jgi:hypothetical protein
MLMTSTPEEVPSAARVDRTLMDLAHRLHHFSVALDLFDYCDARMGEPKQAGIHPTSEENRKYAKWQIIAARDGAFQVFHFGKAMDSLKSALQGAKTLGSHVDFKTLRIAEGVFNGYFGNIDGVRHTIGHAAEFADRMSEHGTTEDIPGVVTSNGPRNLQVMIADVLVGRRYVATYQGAPVEYEISGETLAKLESVLSHIRSSFSRVPFPAFPKVPVQQPDRD